MTEQHVEAAGQAHGFSSFEDKALRRGFIRKVLAILCAQLTLVTVMMLVTLLVESVHTYLRDSRNFGATMGLLIGSIVFYLGTIFTLICVPSLRRRYPTNIILLFVVTIASGFMLSILCAMFTVDTVMMAFGVTVLCCASIFVFSFNTKYDLSSRHGIVFCLLWGLLLRALLFPIPYSTTASKVFAGIGAIIFMFVLVHDIHRVIGKSSENALSPEEYIVGALEIYLDIFNIFIYIVRIFGGR